MYLLFFMTGYSEPPYFGFLRGKSLVLTTACQLFCLKCVMVIKTAFFFVIINMNIVTCVKSVSSRGHCGDGLKIPPQLPFKRLKSCLMVRAPLR